MKTKQQVTISSGFMTLLVGVLIGALGLAFWIAVGDLIVAILK